MIYVEYTISGTRTYTVEPHELVEQYPETEGMDEDEMVNWIYNRNDSVVDWIAEGEVMDEDVYTEALDSVWSVQ